MLSTPGTSEPRMTDAAPLRHHLETQLLEDAKDFVGLQFFSQNAVHLGKMQRHRSQIDLPRNHVAHAAIEFATAGLQDQFRHAVTRKYGGLEIRASFEAMRSIRVQTVAPRHFANDARVPPR